MFNISWFHICLLVLLLTLSELPPSLDHVMYVMHSCAICSTTPIWIAIMLPCEGMSYMVSGGTHAARCPTAGYITPSAALLVEALGAWLSR